MDTRHEVFIELAENNNMVKNQILDFLERINNEYPVSLIEKIDFQEYITKVFKFGFILEAKVNNSIVGILTFYANNHREKEGVISLIGVLNKYRRFGIASKLYLKSFEIMKEEGMVKVFTFTHKDNYESIKFHEKLGFYIDPARESNYEYNISLLRKL